MYLIVIAISFPDTRTVIEEESIPLKNGGRKRPILEEKMNRMEGQISPKLLSVSQHLLQLPKFQHQLIRKLPSFHTSIRTQQLKCDRLQLMVAPRSLPHWGMVIS
jgi:hypothetical protein